MSSVHVHIGTGEMTAKDYVRQIVEDHVTRTQEHALDVTVVIGILIVIKIVLQIVALHTVTNTMEVVLPVPMVRMVRCATIRVI
jgi:hypothetical protein